MAQIQTLTDRQTGNTIYPETCARAVYYADGTTVEAHKMQLFIDRWNMAWGEYGGYDTAEPGKPFVGNGIRMTYEEALAVMEWHGRHLSNDYSRRFFAYPNQAMVPIHVPNATMMSFEHTFQSCMAKTVVFVSNIAEPVINIENGFAMFNSSNVEEIVGALKFSPTAQLTSAFAYASKLREVRIKGLASNASFAWAKWLSTESLEYMVANAANTAAISITLHPDVYARLDAGLIATAAEKQITFVTN